MKRLVFITLFLLSVKGAFAQKDLLSFNEQNKYVYYQVVDQLGTPADSLEDRALYFLKTEYPKAKIKKSDVAGELNGSGKFVIYANVLIANKEEAQMTYTFHIECKDQKYRYWLTDFVFTPYQIDRYGMAVPQPGMETDLESGLTKLNQAQLDKYLAQTSAFSKKFGDKLHQYMLTISALPKKETKRKVVTTTGKDW